MYFGTGVVRGLRVGRLGFAGVLARRFFVSDSSSFIFREVFYLGYVFFNRYVDFVI